MEFINHIVIAPGEQQIALHRYLMILVMFLHVPYAGMLVGSALLSVLINMFHLHNPSENFSRFSREMLDHLAVRKTPALVLGVLPLLSLILLNVHWFAGANFPFLPYLCAALVLIIAGFILLIGYRSGFNGGRAGTLPHILTGGAGVALLFAGYFLLLSSLTLLNAPGKWAFIDRLRDVIFTWNSIWKFTQFIMLSVASAGIGILFFFFRWPGKNVDANSNFGRLAKYFASGSALAGALLLAPVSFFFHVTSPVAAMSLQVYAVWIGVLFLLMVVCMYLLAILWSGNTRHGTLVFILFLLSVLGLITGDQLAVENADKEHTLQLVEKAEAARSEREEAMQMATAKSGAKEGEGKKLYEAKCTACHAFDRRLVGPPHREVIPKYKDNFDGLVAFLRHPSKKDPDYPPMPNLGLSEAEARAIAKYLFEEIIKKE
jgi:cytochrome c